MDFNEFPVAYVEYQFWTCLYYTILIEMVILMCFFTCEMTKPMGTWYPLKASWVWVRIQKFTHGTGMGLGFCLQPLCYRTGICSTTRTRPIAFLSFPRPNGWLGGGNWHISHPATSSFLACMDGSIRLPPYTAIHSALVLPFPWHK
jgi:hypothetical protein